MVNINLQAFLLAKVEKQKFQYLGFFPSVYSHPPPPSPKKQNFYTRIHTEQLTAALGVSAEATKSFLISYTSVISILRKKKKPHSLSIHMVICSVINAQVQLVCVCLGFFVCSEWPVLPSLCIQQEFFKAV